MLIVKDFEWSQTQNSVYIQVPLNGTHSKDVDIVTHENFIKIHASPYLFEAFLLHSINEDESRVQLMRDEARFILHKAEPIEWLKLERDFIDKAEKLQVKNEILERIEQKTKEKLKKKLELKEQIKRSEVENSIARDAEIRSKIENIQKLSIAREMAKVEEIKNSVPETFVSSCPVYDEPPIRKSGIIQITFSKRNFITPKRESQDPAEQEWLRKTAEARKEIGFVPEDLRPEERDPMYLKRKGDEFYQQQNYLAAISAYSTGIKIASKCYELYLNRSAAHFVKQNYQRCIEDCSKALELLDPPVQSNLKARLQAITRRGAALCKLGFLKQAHDEFVAAIKLDPNDEVLKNDAELLRVKIENLSSTDDDD
ncbi:hypothetical protein PVAND_014233 [Polypedilum vanderplanki]|uniref:Dynein axonemal assembly factor 4 n=1 Tax=Polypedilum vanderplanki TaxID=319348 RepID=A0A9J6CTD3_POLVA|nr:hypothetical protein PVAND_014233 [Polypedilum vanderplanki]